MEQHQALEPAARIARRPGCWHHSPEALRAFISLSSPVVI